MQIEAFERSEFTSIGLITGEGLAYTFLAMNDTGRIEILHERVDGEWMVLTGPPPANIRSLVGAKCADERWRHDEGEAVVDLRGEP